MAWTAPMTAVAGSILTAAQMNVFVRDNLAETMPAKSVLPASHFVTSGWGEVTARRADARSYDEQVSVTATSFDAPEDGRAGPAMTLDTGVMALVGYKCQFQIPSTTARIEMSYDVSGATEIEALKNCSLGYSASGNISGTWWRMGGVDLCTGLTPGSNTFTLKYNVSSVSGYVVYRRIWVFPL